MKRCLDILTTAFNLGKSSQTENNFFFQLVSALTFLITIILDATWSLTHIAWTLNELLGSVGLE